MKTYRCDKQIITINPERQVIERRVFPSINAAKRANRGTKHPTAEFASWPQAQGCTTAEESGPSRAELRGE